MKENIAFKMGSLSFLYSPIFMLILGLLTFVLISVKAIHEGVKFSKGQFFLVRLMTKNTGDYLLSQGARFV